MIMQALLKKHQLNEANSMNKHDYSYDWLRAFSMIMIVLCHICQGFGISPEFGYYLGGTYVSVFLMLSAFLLGKRYKEQVMVSPREFLIGRMNKLIPTYYIYLTIIFILIGIYIGFEYLTAKQVVGHYVFLNWFIPSTRIVQPPLPQLGHLWFMSCIVMAYLIVAMLASAFKLVKIPKKFWNIYTFIALSLGIIFCALSRFFVYPSVVFALFPVMFFKGEEIVCFVEKFSATKIVILLLLCNLGAIVGFFNDLYNYPLLVFCMISVNAILWIISAPIVFNREHINGLVAFLSTISFEIYLVHHPLCLGCYSLVKYMPGLLAVISVFAISIIAGHLLNYIVREVRSCTIAHRG